MYMVYGKIIGDIRYDVAIDFIEMKYIRKFHIKLINKVTFYGY